MADKEICAICNKKIEDNPVPYYQAKATDGEPLLWRHEDCHKLEEEE